MKNPRAVAMLAVSLVLGLGAAGLGAAWLAQQGSMASSKVTVAAVDIELGSRLNGRMLKTVDWPSSAVPEGAVVDGQVLEDRVVKTSILRGEPILASKLAPEGTKGGLSAVIADGKRAMTVRVNDVIGVAGFALPGNYVDIVVNTQRDGGGSDSREISKIVLKRILVLAVAQEAGRDETKPKVVNAVTLEVTPQEAERLDLARSVGTLSLVLRNQVDKDPVYTEGIVKRQMLADGDQSMDVPKAAAPAKSPRRRTKAVASPTPALTPAPVEVAAAPPIERVCVEVIKGNTKSVDCF